MAVHTEHAPEYCGKILSERRKAKKPLMEKMRRARINDCLNELKSLVLESLNKDAARYSKMEKADILEMSVQYLREIRKQEKYQKAATIAEFRAGFNHCAQEVTKNLVDTPGSEKLRTNLMNHLALCCQGNTSKPVQSSQRLPVETRTTLSPVGAMWVCPSPPPSPLCMSPPVSPTLSNSSLHSTALVQQPSSLEEEHQITQKQSPSSRIWRPWDL